MADHSSLYPGNQDGSLLQERCRRFNDECNNWRLFLQIRSTGTLQCWAVLLQVERHTVDIQTTALLSVYGHPC